MTTGPRQRPGDGGEKGREEGGQEDGRDRDRVPSLRAPLESHSGQLRRGSQAKIEIKGPESNVGGVQAP